VPNFQTENISAYSNLQNADGPHLQDFQVNLNNIGQDQASNDHAGSSAERSFMYDGQIYAESQISEIKKVCPFLADLGEKALNAVMNAYEISPEEAQKYRAEAENVPEDLAARVDEIFEKPPAEADISEKNVAPKPNLEVTQSTQTLITEAQKQIIINEFEQAIKPENLSQPRTANQRQKEEPIRPSETLFLENVYLPETVKVDLEPIKIVYDKLVPAVVEGVVSNESVPQEDNSQVKEIRVIRTEFIDEHQIQPEPEPTFTANISIAEEPAGEPVKVTDKKIVPDQYEPFSVIPIDHPEDLTVEIMDNAYAKLSIPEGTNYLHDYSQDITENIIKTEPLAENVLAEVTTGPRLEVEHIQIQNEESVEDYFNEVILEISQKFEDSDVGVRDEFIELIKEFNEVFYGLETDIPSNEVHQELVEIVTRLLELSNIEIDPIKINSIVNLIKMHDEEINEIFSDFKDDGTHEVLLQLTKLFKYKHKSLRVVIQDLLGPLAMAAAQNQQYALLS